MPMPISSSLSLPHAVPHSPSVLWSGGLTMAGAPWGGLPEGGALDGDLRFFLFPLADSMDTDFLAVLLRCYCLNFPRPGIIVPSIKQGVDS